MLTIEQSGRRRPLVALVGMPFAAMLSSIAIATSAIAAPATMTAAMTAPMTASTTPASAATDADPIAALVNAAAASGTATGTAATAPAGIFGPASSNPATLQASPALTDAALARLHALSERASELAFQAVGMLGIQYQRGGNTPETGLDCSGLVRYVFKQAWGKILPRTSEEISHVGKQVDHADMQPGDLVFYNTLKRGFSHVGIYLGDNKFIHSPSAGGQVRIESMDLAYWKQRFNGARRIRQADPANPREASLQQ